MNICANFSTSNISSTEEGGVGVRGAGKEEAKNLIL
jgi:hypothetical protein